MVLTSYESDDSNKHLFWERRRKAASKPAESWQLSGSFPRNARTLVVFSISTS